MDIDDLRQKIADLDKEIIQLVAARMDVAKEIGKWKNEKKKPIRDPAVEKEVIRRYIALGQQFGISEHTSKELATALIREAVDVQASLSHPLSPKKVLIIGGKGKMGEWLHNFFSTDGHIVDVIGRNGPALSDIVDDYEVIIISTPISTVKSKLEELSEIASGQLIFDISSLKSPFVTTIKGMAQNLKVCSVHPMFGPTIPSVYDRNIIICDCGNAAAVHEASSLFDGHGANITHMDIDEHDRCMAYVLGMSHAVNIAFFTALVDSGISYDKLKEAGSTTFQRMAESAIEVSQENPLLYYEIQHLNENAVITWAKFMNAVDKVMKASLDEDSTSFVEIMKRGKDYFSQSR
ncbi:MAG: chorismate mutase / prephenate dehydrogenase [Candidatus Methanomethylophilaceae archaeon]|nr:chorismate mutase / prephenate dehydrogenase [Candidatus Methanomethylophilaceae archaeon]MDI3541733.1 chorismate mutase / prephenate dehydrogenase [Candidatus Methanomethylophilaceae archaeon]HIJ00957.1 prephenate dehydrogenase/arogenate dehydrogenase family protein [Candidatus Methanomethylophilaceae archaeon]